MSFIGKSSSKSILRGPGRVLGFLEKGSPTLTWGKSWRSIDRSFTHLPWKTWKFEPVAGQVWSAFCEVPRGLYCVLLQWRQRGDPVIQKIHKTSGWKRSDFTGESNDGFLGVPLMKKNTPTNSLLIYSYSIGIAWDDPPWLYCRHNFMSVPPL